MKAIGAAAILWLILAMPYSATAGKRGKELPFPVKRTTILRQEKVVYTVTGRVRIPDGVEITCLRDVHVVGKGKGAVIEVQGKLKVHGVGAREVIFENVTIELMEEFQSVHMDMTIFRKGAAVRTVPKKSSAGKRFFLEMVDFEDDATLNLTFNDGPITLSSVCSDKPVHITGVTPKGKEQNKIKLFIRGCAEYSDHPGLIGGLIVTNVYDTTIRINRLGGDLSACRGCRTLIFDGNKVTSKKLEFTQTEKLDFSKTKVMKCDIYSDKVTAVSPGSNKKTKDRIFMDRCWFKGIRDPKKVRSDILEDGEGDKKNVVRIELGKVGKRPLELAGAWIR